MRSQSQRLSDEIDDEWEGNSSQEFIINRKAGDAVNDGRGIGMGIRKEETFEVTVSENRDFGSHGQGQGYAHPARGVDYKVQVS